jgi:hypothetical protein
MTCRKIKYSSRTATTDDHARPPRSSDAAGHRCGWPVRHPQPRGAGRYQRTAITITSGGNRNPANPDLGTGTRAGPRRINPACPGRSSANATVPFSILTQVSQHQHSGQTEQTAHQLVQDRQQQHPMMIHPEQHTRSQGQDAVPSFRAPQAAGWRVVRLWEHESVQEAVEIVISALSESDDDGSRALAPEPGLLCGSHPPRTELIHWPGRDGRHLPSAESTSGCRRPDVCVALQGRVSHDSVEEETSTWSSPWACGTGISSSYHSPDIKQATQSFRFFRHLEQVVKRPSVLV